MYFDFLEYKNHIFFKIRKDHQKYVFEARFFNPSELFTILIFDLFLMFLLFGFSFFFTFWVIFFQG